MEAGPWAKEEHPPTAPIWTGKLEPFLASIAGLVPCDLDGIDAFGKVSRTASNSAVEKKGLRFNVGIVGMTSLLPLEGIAGKFYNIVVTYYSICYCLHQEPGKRADKLGPHHWLSSTGC